MLKRLFSPNGNNPNYNNNGMNNMNQGYNNPMYDNYDFKRLETELDEANRQIKELIKRVNRLESYLGIKPEQKYYY